MPALIFVGVLLFSYLVGSIPFGLLIVRFKTGRDIRNVESGRTGGTNVMRAGGDLGRHRNCHVRYPESIWQRISGQVGAPGELLARSPGSGNGYPWAQLFYILSRTRSKRSFTASRRSWRCSCGWWLGGNMVPCSILHCPNRHIHSLFYWIRLARHTERAYHLHTGIWLPRLDRGWSLGVCSLWVYHPADTCLGFTP